MSTNTKQVSRVQPPWYTYDCAVCAELNPTLAENVMRLLAANAGKRSHFFAGRYENIYLPLAELPQLELILGTARQQAATILQLPYAALHIGCWFNLMQQGDVTQAHSHDDDSELLSGTYYISVPPHSGELVLEIAGQSQHIPPQAGRFVFFAPEIIHAVTHHAAPQPRLSIGFNIGIQN